VELVDKADTTGSADVVIIRGFRNTDEFGKFTRYLSSIPLLVAQILIQS